MHEGFAFIGELFSEVMYAAAGRGPRRKIEKELREIFENCRLVVRRPQKQPLYPWLIERLEPEGKTYHDLLVGVPFGLCPEDFEKRLDKLRFAFGAEELKILEGRADNTVIMRVYPEELDTDVSFALLQPPEGMILSLPVGKGKDGIMWLDLADAPHLMVAGQTKGGKSNELHVFFQYLLRKKNCQIFAIDMKRLEFSYLSKHIWYAHEMQEAIAMLEYLHAEMHQRLDLLDGAGCVKIQEYHEQAGADDLPYLVLVADEMSQLAPVLSKNKYDKEQKEHAHSLMVDLLCLARCVGIHIITCTQRPDAQVLPGQLKANIPAAICYKVKNEINSRIVLDNDLGALLPQVPGRCVFQFDGDTTVQSMHLPVKEARKLVSEIPTRPPEKPKKNKPKIAT